MSTGSERDVGTGGPPRSATAYVNELRAAGVALPENIVVVSSVDSTNVFARRLLDALVEEEESVPQLLVLTLHQSAGRGRAGRSWWSPPGSGIYATRVVRLRRLAEAGLLPIAVPAALCDALDTFLGAPCGIKWPNDLVAGARKIGGVLIETIAGRGGGDCALVGIGVNCSQRRDELPGREATSVLLETGAAPPLGVFAAAVLGRLEEALAAMPGDAVERFRHRLVHRPGDRVRFRGGEETVEGAFVGVDDRGHLRLRIGEAERVFASGEVIER